MNAQHTPGPWSVCVQDDSSFPPHTIFADSQIHDGIIKADEWDNFVACAGLNHENVEANARLIAAAPELLDVVTKFVADADKAGIQDFQISYLPAARAAIAKAKATGGAA